MIGLHSFLPRRNTRRGNDDEYSGSGTAGGYPFAILLAACFMISTVSLFYHLDPSAFAAAGVLRAFDLTATHIFAIAGAVACKTRFPGPGWKPFLATLAGGFLTANGGGTLRDLLTGQPLFWLASPEYLLGPLLVGAVCRILTFRGSHSERIAFRLADNTATGWFLVLGMTKAASILPLDHPAFLFLALSVGGFTAIGGGILRDLMILRRRPAVFSSPLVFVVLASGPLLGLFCQSSVIRSLGLDLSSVALWAIAGFWIAGLAEIPRKYR